MKTEKPLNRSEAKFWIHRILAEKTTELRVLAEEISILNHQAQNFDKMGTLVQNSVLQDLNKEFEAFDWDYQFTFGE
jgi:hypothetical protein